MNFRSVIQNFQRQILKIPQNVITFNEWLMLCNVVLHFIWILIDVEINLSSIVKKLDFGTLKLMFTNMSLFITHFHWMHWIYQTLHVGLCGWFRLNGLCRWSNVHCHCEVILQTHRLFTMSIYCREYIVTCHVLNRLYF